MICIYCKGDTAVTNSRKQRGGQSIWRRRHCTACGTIFTSIEQADLSASIRIETSRQELVPFSRDTLFYSIAASCGHRKQSALTDASSLTDTVIHKLLLLHTPLISSATISSTAAQVLKNFDQAAYTYYLAYYQ